MNKWMNILLLRINLHSLNSSSSPKLDLWRTSGSRQNADLLLRENSIPQPKTSVPTTLQSLSETFIKLSSLLKSAQIMFSYNHTMLPGPITSWQTEGEKLKQWHILFSWAPKSPQTVTEAMKSRDACSLEGKLTKLDSVLKSRDIILLTKAYIVKAMTFPVVVHDVRDGP